MKQKINMNYKKRKYDVIIGVDPGVKTGFAVWDGNTFSLIKSYSIYDFFDMAIQYDIKYQCKFIIEDARQRKWYGNSKGKDQGAGWIRTLSGVYESFFKDHQMDYEMIHPLKGGTKWNAKQFKQYTGYEQQTNEHGRDAAVIVFKRQMVCQK